MHNICIMFWSGNVKEEVLFVAIDSRERSFFEFRSRGGPPEVESICMTSIKIFKCMFDPVVMVLLGTAVCL